MAMPDVTNGLAKLRKARQDQDDLIAAAEEIDRIGGLERAAREAEAAMVPIRKKQDKANADLAETQALVTGAAQRVLELQTEYDTLDDAFEKKNLDATRKASKIIADAKAAAAQIKIEADADREAIGQDIDGLRAKRDSLTSEVNVLQTQIKTIKEQKAALARRLSE